MLYSSLQTETPLLCQVALITGADSGIGRAVALAYAREGADIAIAYLNEHEDAEVRPPRHINASIRDPHSALHMHYFQSVLHARLCQYFNHISH